jgi:hypothetical protein
MGENDNNGDNNGDNNDDNNDDNTNENHRIENNHGINGHDDDNVVASIREERDEPLV